VAAKNEKQGHVKIARRAFDSDPFWLETRVYSRFEAWLWLIERAAWKDHKTMIGGHVTTLRRGEVPTSLTFLAKAWGWGPRRVRTFLALLVRDGRAVVRDRVESRHTFGHTYFLVNYDSYQRTRHTKGHTDDTQPTHSRHVSEATKQLSKEEKSCAFEEFWSAYGKKLGRKKCEAKFAQLSRVGKVPDDIAARALAYRQHHEQAGKLDYLLHPLTYLNGERWLDESLPYATPKTKHVRGQYDQPSEERIRAEMQRMTEETNP